MINMFKNKTGTGLFVVILSVSAPFINRATDIAVVYQMIANIVFSIMGVCLIKFLIEYFVLQKVLKIDFSHKITALKYGSIVVGAIVISGILLIYPIYGRHWIRFELPFIPFIWFISGIVFYAIYFISFNFNESAKNNG